MLFNRIYHTGPVTELFCHNKYIFAGIGSQLNVYCTCCLNQIQVIDVLPARVIHGIKLNEFSDGQLTALCIYGQKCLRLVQFDNTIKRLETVGLPVEFNDWIWDVSFIKDDLVCLTLGHNVIVTYDLKQQEVVSSVHCQEKCILYCAQFLCTKEDCVVVAAGTVFNQVVLWSTQSETDDTGRVKPFHRLTGHQGVIFSIDYDSRSDRICSVSDDRSIRLYQLEFPTPCRRGVDWEHVTSHLIHVLYGHSARVWDVRLLQSTFISVGEDSTCCVWSYNGDILQKFKGHKGKSIWSLCVNQVENVVVTGGGDNSVRLWDLNNVEYKSTGVTSLDLQLEEADFPRNTQFIDTDKAVVVMNSGKLLLYNLVTSDISTIMDDVIFSSYTVMDICTDTHTIAIGNVHGTVRILSMTGSSPEFIHSDVGVCDGKVFSILWLNRHTLLTTSPDGIVNLWNITINGASKDIRKDYTFELTTSRHRWVSAAALSHDGGHIVCGDRTGSVFLYQLSETEATGKLVQTFPKLHGKGGVTYVCCHGDDVYTAGRDGTYRLFAWNPDNTLSQLQNKKVLKGLEWIERLNIIPNDDIQVLGFHSDTFVVWSIEQNQKLLEIECGGGHRAWDFTSTDDMAYFVYVKSREVKLAKVEMRSNQVIVKKCLHGRELCDGKFISAGKDSTGHNVVAIVTASEDTSVRLSFLHYDSCIATLDVRDVLSGHISSVRCLYVCSSSLKSQNSDTSCQDRKLIFSGGGRAQLKVWRVTSQFSNNSDEVQSVSNKLQHSHLHSNDPKDKDVADSVDKELKKLSTKQDVCKSCLALERKDTINECYFSYECLGGLQLSSLTRKHWKPWRQPLDNSDPETRIVDLSVITPDSRCQPHSTLYVISAACSDGVFRLLTFCETSKEINLIGSFPYHDHSILKTSHSIISDPKMLENQSAGGGDGCHEQPEEQCQQPIRILVISAATDGQVAFWDMTGLCHSVTSDCASVLSTTDHSLLQPLFTIDVHQSGINSLYFGKFTDNRHILITGGDDNAVKINMISVDIIEQKVCMSVRATGKCLTAHSAQITGVYYIHPDKFVTASIDQRICLWKFEVEQSNIKVEQIDSMFTNVSDVSNIDVWTDDSGKQCIHVLVSGNGMEIIQLNTINIGPQSPDSLANR